MCPSCTNNPCLPAGWTCDECGEKKYKGCHSTDSGGENHCCLEDGHDGQHQTSTPPGGGSSAFWEEDGGESQMFP